MKKLSLIIFLSIIGCSGPTEESKELFKNGIKQYIKKDLKGSESTLVRVIDVDESNAEAYFMLAKIYYFQQKNNKFNHAIERFLDLSDNDIEGLRLKARWLIQQKKYNESEIILKGILEKARHDIASLYLLGTVQQLKNKNDEAIVTYSHALSSYIFLKEIHGKLDTIYTKIGLEDRAKINKHMYKSIVKWEKGIGK